MGNRTDVRFYDICPMAKPRINRASRFSDKAKRYYAWRDLVRLLGITFPEGGGHVIFTIPMAASWSGAKKARMNATPHQQVPDKDNLEKALLDACFTDDRKVWDGRASKVWGYEGRIDIYRHDPSPLLKHVALTSKAIRLRSLRLGGHHD